MTGVQTCALPILELLAMDELLCLQMGKIGYERVKATYQKKDFLDQYEALYNTIMAQH